MTRDDLFKINAGIVRDLVKAIAEHLLPMPSFSSSPTRSTALSPSPPKSSKAAGKFSTPRSCLVSPLSMSSVPRPLFPEHHWLQRTQPEDQVIPVIGGHSGETIVPLFSQAKPSPSNIPQDKLEALTNRLSRDDILGLD